MWFGVSLLIPRKSWVVHKAIWAIQAIGAPANGAPYRLKPNLKEPLLKKRASLTQIKSLKCFTTRKYATRLCPQLTSKDWKRIVWLPPIGGCQQGCKTNTAKDWKNRDVTVQILKQEPAGWGKSLIENISRIFGTSCNKKFIFRNKTQTFTFQLLFVVVYIPVASSHYKRVGKP